MGYGEIELELPYPYADTLYHLFGQLGARGVTILVASGQDGVGAGECVIRGDWLFKAEFPASCTCEVL